MSEQVKTQIEDMVKGNKVVLFIRGTPEAPRCGFSARTVKVFKDLNIPFATADMDASPDLWKTLTALNDWPTSPQIYVNGEFVGGCDIVIEMNRNGDLQKMLGAN